MEGKSRALPREACRCAWKQASVAARHREASAGVSRGHSNSGPEPDEGPNKMKKIDTGNSPKGKDSVGRVNAATHPPEVAEGKIGRASCRERVHTTVLEKGTNTKTRMMK